MVSKTSHYSDISVFTVQSTTCRKTRTLHKTVHLHANSKQMVYRKNIINNIFLVTYSPSWLKWRVTFLEEYAVINIQHALKNTDQNSNKIIWRERIKYSSIDIDITKGDDYIIIYCLLVLFVILFWILKNGDNNGKVQITSFV